MEPEERNNIREVLDFNFGVNSGNAEAESWDIINCDLRGLQARCHFWYEKASPFASNCTWREILYRCAYYGLSMTNVSEHDSEYELEQAVMQALYQRIEKTLSQQEKSEIAKILINNPGLRAFGNAGTLVALALLKNAQSVGVSTSAELTVWLSRQLGTQVENAVLAVLTSQGAKLLFRSLNVILWGWLVYDVLDFLLGTSWEKVVPGILPIVIKGQILQAM